MKGRTPNPVIDRVATTREEADRMLRASLRAIEPRASAGDGKDKAHPTPHQPAIVVVVDEGSVTFGMGTGGPSSFLDGVTNAHLSRLIKQLVITGRSEAIDPIVAVQRGSVTMVGDGDFKSQFGLRIGLGVATEADARLIVPHDSRIAVDLARLDHPGSGIVSRADPAGSSPSSSSGSTMTTSARSPNGGAGSRAAPTR
jgi:DNA segregation ATPase FtsK/SpoIIIE-like protein